MRRGIPIPGFAPPLAVPLPAPLLAPARGLCDEAELNSILQSADNAPVDPILPSDYRVMFKKPSGNHMKKPAAIIMKKPAAPTPAAPVDDVYSIDQATIDIMLAPYLTKFVDQQVLRKRVHSKMWHIAAD